MVTPYFSVSSSADRFCSDLGLTWSKTISTLVTYFVKAPDPISHKKIGALIKGLECLDRDLDDTEILAKLGKAARNISPDSGSQAMEALRRGLDRVDPVYKPLGLCIRNDEDLRTSLSGYWRFGFTFGSVDDARGKTAAMLAYLDGLVHGTDVRGLWEDSSVGSETFVRIIDGKVIWKDFDPEGKGEAEDREELESGVYSWWHDGLPERIKVGRLNDPDYWEDVYGDEEG